MTHLGHVRGVPGMRPTDGVRTRPSFVAILSVWSNPRRSKCTSRDVSRSQLSDVASGDITVISRELARSGQNLAFCTPTKVRRGGSTSIRGSGSTLHRPSIQEFSGPHFGALQIAPNRRRSGVGGELALWRRPKVGRSTVSHSAIVRSHFVGLEQSTAF